MYTKFWLESLKERNNSEYLDVDGSKKTMDVKEIGWDAVDWSQLA
jgi:hypothetical protein